jgi:hypothetical protein
VIGVVDQGHHVGQLLVEHIVLVVLEGPDGPVEVGRADEGQRDL